MAPAYGLLQNDQTARIGYWMLLGGCTPVTVKETLWAPTRPRAEVSDAVIVNVRVMAWLLAGFTPGLLRIETGKVFVA